MKEFKLSLRPASDPTLIRPAFAGHLLPVGEGGIQNEDFMKGRNSRFSSPDRGLDRGFLKDHFSERLDAGVGAKRQAVGVGGPALIGHDAAHNGDLPQSRSNIGWQGGPFMCQALQ